MPVRAVLRASGLRSDGLSQADVKADKLVIGLSTLCAHVNNLGLFIGAGAGEEFSHADVHSFYC